MWKNNLQFVHLYNGALYVTIFVNTCSEDYVFGYVNVFQNELKVKDLNIYKAYYCGVCHSTSEKLSFFARFGLSYDITFMAILLDSLSEDEVCFEMRRCIAHPWKKRAAVINNSAVDFSACVGVMLTYLKFKDDLHDDRSLKGLFGTWLFYGGMKKAAKKYPYIYEEIGKYLNELSSLEKSGCEVSDEVADVFGKLLGSFASYGGECEKALYQLLYHLGRWIYLIDAADDFERDLKSKSYNPFKYSYNNKKELAENIELPLTLTLESMASAFELLGIKKNREILQNIIYQGTLAKQTKILKGTLENESL